MTVAALPVALAIGSSALEGIQGFTAAQYRARVADMNRKVALENADRAVYRSQVEAQDQDAITLAALGEQIAGQASSGLSLTGRSSAAARRNARTLGRLDRERIRQAGDLEAYNYEVDAANFAAEKSAAKSEGIFSLIGGGLGIAKSLVGGAGSVKNSDRFAIPEPYTARLPRPRPRSLVY